MTDDEFKELAYKIDEIWKMVAAPYIVLIAAVILMLFLFFFGCSPAAAGGFLVIENNRFECSVEGCPCYSLIASRAARVVSAHRRNNGSVEQPHPMRIIVS